MKVNFYLKNSKVDYDTWIYCLIRYQNKSVKVYTNKKINPKFWNPESQQVRQTTKFPNHVEYNVWLKGIVSFIDKLWLDWERDHKKGLDVPTIPAEYLKENLRGYFSKHTKEERADLEKRSFWGYYDTFLTRMDTGARVHFTKGTPIAPKTIVQFRNLKRHLKNFEQKKRFKIGFDAINLKFYNLFMDYLTIDLQLTPNTIGKLITNLKVFMREALEEGLTTNNAFTHRKFKSINFKSETVYLTDTEIQALIDLDLNANPRFERVRDMFVIGCYTGLRYSDLTKIKPENIIDGMIELIQTKTGNPVFVPMVSVVSTLLLKYENRLPKISNQKYNEYLYEVCKRCDILKTEITVNGIKGGKKEITIKPKYEFISSHTARRSFATNEYKTQDLEVSEIMSITGHKTEKAFYKYIRETPREAALRIKQKIEQREAKKMLTSNHLKAV